MEIKIKTTEGLVDASIEIVNGIMIVSPKELPNCSNFKDGDIIVCDWSNSEWICFLKGEVDTIGSTRYFVEDYCGMFFKGQGSDKEVWIEASYSDSATFIRPATEEEKQKLFDKLKEEGYEWDAEKKEIVKLKWEPKEGEKYYRPAFSYSSFWVYSHVFKEAFRDNLARYLNNGWIFKTEEECRAFCDKLNEAINSVKP